MYRLNVDWKPGSISLCINGPNANTGFAMDVELFAQDNQWRVRMPNGSGAASGTLTGELFTNGTAISGRIRGWGIDTAMRRIDIQPASSSVDALLSGTGQETAASGDFSGSFTAQTPGGPTFPAPCTPLGWTLTPR